VSDCADYRFAWQDYRRRVLWFFGVWLGGFLVITLLARLVSLLPFREMVFAILGPTWMVGFLIVAIRLSLFRCPRCRHPFFRVWWFNNPLARKCMHCRLPKWSDTDPDDKRKT